MKKLICMLMAAVTALSLAACGTEGDTETKKKREPQVEQIPTTSTVAQPAGPEEAYVDRFVGDWVMMGKNGEEETFTLCADGTMQKDGVQYTWKAWAPDWNDDYLLKLSVYLMEGQEGWHSGGDSYNHSFTIKFTETQDHTLLAAVKDEKAGYYAKYYDYIRVNDYQIVELTVENMLQYLELKQSFSYGTNDFGYTEVIDNEICVQFKEGVGFPSYCTALFTYRMTTKEVTFAEKPGEYTVGSTVYVQEGEPNIWSNGNPELTGEYKYSFYYTEYWDMFQQNLGGETYTCEMIFFELIGAKALVGKVYIPVAK